MGHARAAPNAIGDELLPLLPRDGGSIPNRAARALISKRLAQPVSNEAYFAARDRLMHDNIVGRVRGQGGSVFLVNDPLPTPPQAEPVAEPGPGHLERRGERLDRDEHPAELGVPADQPDQSDQPDQPVAGSAPISPTPRWPVGTGQAGCVASIRIPARSA
mgnify:CR=1 FL=1